jgi:hypothetical protein
MTLRGIDLTGMAYLIVLAIGGIAVYQLVTKGPQWARDLADKMKGAAQAGADAVNPMSDKNLASRAANAMFAPPGESIGTWFASKFNPDVRAADAAMSRSLILETGWETDLASGWEESSGDAMRPATIGSGGAAFGVYPSMR